MSLRIVVASYYNTVSRPYHHTMSIGRWAAPEPAPNTTQVVLSVIDCMSQCFLCCVVSRGFFEPLLFVSAVVCEGQRWSLAKMRG